MMKLDLCTSTLWIMATITVSSSCAPLFRGQHQTRSNNLPSIAFQILPETQLGVTWKGVPIPRLKQISTGMKPPGTVNRFRCEQIPFLKLPVRESVRVGVGVPTRPALCMSSTGQSKIPEDLMKENIITDTVVDKAREVQAWLENLYDSVDYEAALVRAGADEDEGEAAPTMSEEAEWCEGMEGELTYGEMDMRFFLALMRHLEPAEPSTFVDVGCGRGQLVLAAARTGHWKRCVGIEIEKTVLEIGRGALMLAREDAEQGIDFREERCEVRAGNMYEEREAFTSADVVFAYATCFATSDGVTLKRLSASLARAIPPGCRLVTVNKRLDEASGFQLLQVFAGPNPDSVNDPALAYLWAFQP